MKYKDFAIGWQVEKLRFHMVKFAMKHGISSAAREFQVTRKTVRKWVQRYDGNKMSLSNRSRRPTMNPNQMPVKLERKIIEYRKRYPTFGACRIKDELGINYSHIAIHRVMKQNGLIKPHRKKWLRKRDLRALKANMAPFEKVQIDVKYLDDIPEFFPIFIRYNLPRYQYTVRDIRTGFTLIAYSYEHSQTASVNFLIYVADRFSALGVDTKGCVVQTDNGSEFVAPWNSGKRSAFEEWVDALFAEHKTIPPGAKTYQSDVESFHRLIEDEFYKIESVNSRLEFFKKAATYIVWFNWARRNHYKGDTPTAIWKGDPSTIAPWLSPPPNLQYIFPILLDKITPYILKQGGYHVPLLDITF